MCLFTVIVLAGRGDAFGKPVVSSNPGSTCARSLPADTASDFGRALSSNGSGSDHCWGSHHFIADGAVRGRDIYGQLPVTALGSADDVGSDRLLPSTTVTEYAATVAT